MNLAVRVAGYAQKNVLFMPPNSHETEKNDTYYVLLNPSAAATVVGGTEN